MLPLQPHLLEGVEISRYRVETLVARGGMGLVYRARDMRLDRPVALKVLSPDMSEDPRFRERFVRESRMAAAVDHPHIIPIYEADNWEGILYLAMRFVHGADLHSVIATNGPLDRTTTLQLLGQTAAALDAAHGAGLVHRDVKPANLLMAGATPDRIPDGVHVYLTDFGLTKKSTSISGITMSGQFLGTLNYVAPEQIHGVDVDQRTDLYALACVAFEMLTGGPPFVRDSDAATLWAHIYAPPPSISAVRPDLPAAVDEVFLAAMAKDRADRPESCGEFVAQLRSTLTESLPDPAPGPAPGADEVPRGDARPPHPSLPSGPDDGVLAPDMDPPDYPPAPRAPVTVQQPRGRREGDPRPSLIRRSRAHPVPPRSPSPRRGRAAWLALAGVVAVLVAVLAVWRPWQASDDLVEQDLPARFAAELPTEWQRFAPSGAGAYEVLAPRNWTEVFRGNGGAAAAQTADDEPQAVVGVYVEEAHTLDADTPARLVQLVEAHVPAMLSLTAGQASEVDGREFVEFGGTLKLGPGEQLLLHGIVALEEPRLLLIFFAPPAVSDEWRPVFDQVVQSIRADS